MRPKSNISFLSLPKTSIEKTRVHPGWCWSGNWLSRLTCSATHHTHLPPPHAGSKIFGDSERDFQGTFTAETSTFYNPLEENLGATLRITFSPPHNPPHSSVLTIRQSNTASQQPLIPPRGYFGALLSLVGVFELIWRKSVFSDGYKRPFNQSTHRRSRATQYLLNCAVSCVV